jgi:hypothetical protein
LNSRLADLTSEAFLQLTPVINLVIKKRSRSNNNNYRDEKFFTHPPYYLSAVAQQYIARSDSLTSSNSEIYGDT